MERVVLRRDRAEDIKMAPKQVETTLIPKRESNVSHVSEKGESVINDQKTNLQNASSFADIVLSQIEDLLKIVHVSDDCVQGEKRPLVHQKDMCVQASPIPEIHGEFKKPCKVSACTQTCGDLESNTIAVMQEKVTTSRCQLEIMKEHFHNIEQDFRRDLAQRSMAMNKADAMLKAANTDLALLRDRVGRISLSMKRDSTGYSCRDENRATPVEVYNECFNFVPDVETAVHPPPAPSGDHPPHPTTTDFQSRYNYNSRLYNQQSQYNFHLPRPYQQQPHSAESSAGFNRLLSPSVTFQCGPDFNQSRSRPRTAQAKIKRKPGDREDVPIVKQFDRDSATKNKKRRVSFGMEEILYI